MKVLSHFAFTTLLLINLILFSQIVSIDNDKTDLENEIDLKEQESKIEEIKLVNKEIETQLAKKNTEKTKKEHKVESSQQEIEHEGESLPSEKPNKTMKINTDFTVSGCITANKFYSETAKISGVTRVGHVLNSKTVNTDQITSQSLVTEKILSNTGVLTIEGDLIINNDVMADTVNMRTSSFILEGIKQWGLVHHDDFETEKSFDGWSDKRANRCKNGHNTFLGGHCNFSYTEVSKIFKNLPVHEKLKINAAFHMLDSWDGEYAYMKIDDETIWTKSGQHSKNNGIDICGGDFNDPAYNIPIDVTVPHNNTEVKVSFGSTLDEDPCNESFGIDDVMIYVR